MSSSIEEKNTQVKVLCTCSKCLQKNANGLLIVKATRTRHRKSDREQEKLSSLSSSSDSIIDDTLR
ncbi:148_t:CDS:1, partial [Funneliformis geosporum]